MKRFKLLLATVLLALCFTGCGKDEYYPKRDLEALDSKDMEVVEHYKEILRDSDLFYCEDFALKVDVFRSDFFAVLYELDSTGKALDSHCLKGDILSDIYETTFSINNYQLFVDYENAQYDITIDEKNGDIVGTRKFDKSILDSEKLHDIDWQIASSGYPEADFEVKEVEPTYKNGLNTLVITYGDYEIRGTLREQILVGFLDCDLCANTKYDIYQVEKILYVDPK